MADEEVVRERNPWNPPERMAAAGNVPWGAIWAGTMVTMGMEALFVAFGIFIAGAFGGSSAWSVVWFLVTMAVSFYAGAAATTLLSGVGTPRLARLHGLATWGLAVLGSALTGLLTIAVTALNSAPSPLAGLDWGGLELWFGAIWGGIVLSLAAAYFGATRLPRREGAEGNVPVRHRMAG